MSGWNPCLPGVLTLPSGRRIRGRALRRPAVGEPPQFGLYLSARPPGRLRGPERADPGWESHWLRWPDFWVPTDREAADRELVLAWQRCADQRVEVGCAGGRGRTGAALACIAVLDGLEAGAAVDYVREHYDVRAVETARQRRWVIGFAQRRRS